MNEKFLDKFFKTYSKICRKYANFLKLNKFLTSTYYIDSKTKLLYPYQYIDFNLLYYIDTKKQKIEYKDVSKFIENYGFGDYMSLLHLYYISDKIQNNNIPMLSEKEILTLNELYKKIVKYAAHSKD